MTLALKRALACGSVALLMLSGCDMMDDDADMEAEMEMEMEDMDMSEDEPMDKVS